MLLQSLEIICVYLCKNRQMTEVKIVTIPEKKDDEATNKKVKAIVEERNVAIAKKFGVEPFDVEVDLFYNTSQLVSKVGSHDERLGVFSGYKDYEDIINIGHPIAIAPIFGENIDKQLYVMADYSLTKMYLCKVFYPEGSPYKLYYRYLSEVVARLTSGNFLKNSVEYDIKNYSDFKKYKKDIELYMALYVMLEKSGSDFIFENLKTFFEDCDIKKSLMKIYKKEFKELVGLYQKEMIAKDKEIKKIR